MNAADTRHWIESRSLAELIEARDEIISSHVGGTSVDFDTICEELGEDDPHASDEHLMSRWFDACADSLAALFADGPALVYRAVGVDDPAAFAGVFMAGGDVGCHWTYDRSCASTSYHGGSWSPHEVLLVGRAAAGDVCWGTTIQKLFGHPHEREINVPGGIVPISASCLATGSPIVAEPARAA